MDFERPQTDFYDPIYTIRPSAVRRVMGIGVQCVLGLLLIYVAFVQPPAFAFQLFLIGLGGLTLANAVRAWKASEGAIILTEEGLVDQDGQPIALLKDIDKVDRALFSNKPSNGFAIKMKTRQPRGWQPGMWWRLGKRVGIGGVTSGAQTKIVADTLSMMVATRDGTAD